ncbi:Ger(x)C family spore germination protein [Paenibacillaceae bacterium]|nr:Ger(x)C family spore germination protein [Paenibacillaceae bacterium]
MKTYNRAISLLLLLCLPMVLSGCWKQNDLNQITVVSAIGLDAAPNDQIEVTVQLVNPTLPVAAGGGGRRPFALYSAEGDNIYEALELIRNEAKKHIFTPQTRIILIGEQLARRGLEPYMDFFWRDNQQNLTSWVMVSKDKARSTLLSAKELEQVSANQWNAYFRSKLGQKSAAIQLYKFLPRLQQQDLGASAAGIGWMPGSDGKSVLKINDTAVFRKDRMIGWLDEKQTMMMDWVQGESDEGKMRVEGSGHSDESEDGDIEEEEKAEAPPLVYELSNVRVSKTVIEAGNKSRFRVNFHADANLKTTVRQLKLSKIQYADNMRKQLEDEIRQNMNDLFHTLSRQYKSDLVGFGRLVHHKFPQEWKKIEHEWGDYFSRSELEVDVKVHIIKTGLQKDN